MKITESQLRRIIREQIDSAVPDIAFRSRGGYSQEIVEILADGRRIGGINAMATLNFKADRDNQARLEEIAGERTDNWYVVQANIETQYQGQGLGKKLYQELFNILSKKSNGTPVIVGPEASNLPGATSQFALHVWKSLSRLYPSAGNLLLIQPEKIIREQVEEYDYRGEHTSPDSDSAVLYDLTANDVYPADVYSMKGPLYYGDNGGDSNDHQLFSLVASHRNRPKSKIRIYRAVPYEKSATEMIDDITSAMNLYLKRKKRTPGLFDAVADNVYYDTLHAQREKLQSTNDIAPTNIDVINPGDWVTISKKYATDHGRAALGGKYKVLSRVVFAKDLFTDGNSLYEWGWHP